MSALATSNVSGRRMPSVEDFLRTDALCPGAVQTQRRDGRPPGGADSHQFNSIPAEVQPPRIRPRVEQSRCLTGLGIGRPQTRTLAKRAGHTRQREILKGCPTAGDLRHDVVNVEGGFLRRLGNPAIFATVVRPLNHTLPEPRRDMHRFIKSALGEHAPISAATTRADQPDQPIPRLRGVQRRSTDVLDPACPARCGAFFRRPSAGEISPDRRALRFSVGPLATYSWSFSAGQSSRGSAECPSAVLLNPCLFVSIRGQKLYECRE